jgi:hypothetical protein
MSHTLGPWEISDRPRKSFASGELMYHVDGPEILFDYEDWGYSRQSASLIAAAPELLEALRVFVSCSLPVSTEIDERGHRWTEAYLDQALPIARAAIAKAEGGQT